MKEYSPTIGIEVHCELKTQSKMFCNCKNDPFSSEANKHICPVCTGQPGAMPVPNKEAIKKVMKVGKALNCSFNEKSKFDRKNYFYPDLPKGYQISQYDLPLCKDGVLMISGKKIGITRIHLEEDTGKLQHTKNGTLIDYNRAGVPLMELVTEPDITSGEEAKAFAQELQLILRYLNVSDADMEKGQMRIEVNVSVSDTNVFGTKVEVKNINSFANAAKAIDFEIARQKEVLSRGEKVIQETRGWDSIKNRTVSQRIKEGSSDYRYFPEPDIPVLDLTEFKVDALPELPWAKRARFKREFELSDKIIEVFILNPELSEYYEKIISEIQAWTKSKNIQYDTELFKTAANYVVTDFLGMFWATKKDDNKYPITPENFAELVVMIYNKEVTSTIAKTILKKMFETGADPSHIVKEHGLSQISESGKIEELAKKVIDGNPKAVEDYRAGKENAIMFLVGQLMRETKGCASPDEAKNILKNILNK